ncbi:cytochrome c oxidase subunit 2 [Herbaspirillum sp. Sphag1AN]|uniref:cytochrome c oxidase subunit II n=1 Tax=unclassified Herbaspirillum TaxID=2624150 RepID=UPI001614A609|nr:MULTISPECIES: cytochrome c oxidase subunit II [unclassified Herbaspirillum]MBB3212610.1 cytochrome c oxidase subunit 2 [Herbaspirillum sp. Sphag1AN]MBB3245807.1 cytochrome c oxidase subunit 2 [Herbaspirillum sp. Sphag64]
MILAKRLQSLLLGASLLTAALPSWAVVDSDGGPAVLQTNFQPPVTQIAAQIYDLHTMMLIICLIIFVAVFGVMFYSILRHRKSLGHKPATFHESTTVEIAWTVIPFLIVIGMALPATKTVVAMKDASNADITIKATGMQWKWGYDYLNGEGQGIAFLSSLSTPREQIADSSVKKDDNYLLEVDNPLVVPVNKKVRLVTTANDVIHSWTIPAFGVKQDAIPGFVRDTWFKAEKIGTYRGQCVELCGKDHGFMPIVVKVVSDADYKSWVDGKKKEMAAKADDPNKVWTIAELTERGAKVYGANCVACHQVTGKGVPGAFPALDGDPIVNGPKDTQIHLVLNGKNAMPSWKAVLSDTEIAAVITYTRNTWSNKAQENIVQPAEVLADRK